MDLSASDTSDGGVGYGHVGDLLNKTNTHPMIGYHTAAFHFPEKKTTVVTVLDFTPLANLDGAADATNKAIKGPFYEVLGTLFGEGTSPSSAPSSEGSGFLRDDALLAFVVLTDEDESSNKPPISNYPAMFDALKGGERGRWAAAVIAGKTACSSKQFGKANEAKKLKQFISEVGANGVFSSICEGDLTPGVTEALNLFGKACKSFPAPPN